MPFAHVNGASLHYHKTGNGTPIVFIHPPLLTAQAFNYQKAQLSDEFQVITFDVRGHGESKPSEAAVTYPLVVEDMRQLLDFLNVEKAYVCGYSAGASIAIEALLTYPERFIGGILVSGASEISDTWSRGLSWLAAQCAKARPLRRLLSRVISSNNADMELTFQNLYGSSLHGHFANIEQYFRYSMTYSSTKRLSAIQQPVLLIYGEKNERFRPYAHLLHEKLPNSSLYFIKDGQHHLPIKNANRMNDLIRLWVESLQDQATDRRELDFQIARKLNPAMYMHEEQLQENART